MANVVDIRSGDFGLGWRPARGRCFHPTGRIDERGQSECCPHPVAVRGQFLSPAGTGYVVDACPEHAGFLREPRPLR